MAQESNDLDINKLIELAEADDSAALHQIELAYENGDITISWRLLHIYLDQNDGYKAALHAEKIVSHEKNQFESYDFSELDYARTLLLRLTCWFFVVSNNKEKGIYWLKASANLFAMQEHIIQECDWYDEYHPIMRSYALTLSGAVKNYSNIHQTSRDLSPIEGSVISDYLIDIEKNISIVYDESQDTTNLFYKNAKIKLMKQLRSLNNYYWALHEVFEDHIISSTTRSFEYTKNLIRFEEIYLYLFKHQGDFHWNEIKYPTKKLVLKIFKSIALLERSLERKNGDFISEIHIFLGKLHLFGNVFNKNNRLAYNHYVHAAAHGSQRAEAILKRYHRLFGLWNYTEIATEKNTKEQVDYFNKKPWYSAFPQVITEKKIEHPLLDWINLSEKVNKTLEYIYITIIESHKSNKNENLKKLASQGLLIAQFEFAEINENAAEIAEGFTLKNDKNNNPIEKIREFMQLSETERKLKKLIELTTGRTNQENPVLILLSEALHWYEQAALQGDYEAHYRAGKLYGRPELNNPDKARQHLRTAADGGFMEAAIELAKIDHQNKNYQRMKEYLQPIVNNDQASDALKLRAQDLLTIAENELIKEKSEQRLQKLVQRYSHTLSNTIFPNTLYTIAEHLKNHVDLRQDARLLLEAYHAEISIKLENELLQKRYASDNPESLRQLVRGDRLATNDANAHRIEDIFNYALSRVLARFLNQHYAKLEPIRTQVVARCGQSLDALRQNFEEALFFNNPPRTALDWCHATLRPIELCITSPLWQEVGIRRQGLAEALLYGHFSEIIFNAFKYADPAADWFLRVEFGSRQENGMDYLTVQWQNPLGTTTSSEREGMGQGLAALAEDMQQLNGSTDPALTLCHETRDGCFTLRLHYQVDLLRRTPLPDIDLGTLLLAKKQTT